MENGLGSFLSFSFVLLGTKRLVYKEGLKILLMDKANLSCFFMVVLLTYIHVYTSTLTSQCKT